MLYELTYAFLEEKSEKAEVITKHVIASAIRDTMCLFFDLFEAIALIIVFVSGQTTVIGTTLMVAGLICAAIMIAAIIYIRLNKRRNPYVYME